MAEANHIDMPAPQEDPAISIYRDWVNACAERHRLATRSTNRGAQVTALAEAVASEHGLILRAFMAEPETEDGQTYRAFMLTHHERTWAAGRQWRAEEPVMKPYRRWGDARKQWKALAAEGREDTRKGRREDDRESAAFFEIVDIVPTSLSGIAAKLHLLWTVEYPDLDPSAPRDQMPPAARLILTMAEGCGFPGFADAA